MILITAILLLSLVICIIVVAAITDEEAFIYLSAVMGVFSCIFFSIYGLSHASHMDKEDSIYATENNMKDAYHQLHSEFSNPFVHVISGPDSIKQIPDTNMIERVDVIKTNDNDMLVKLDVIQKNNDSYEKKTFNALMTTDSYNAVTNNIYQANQDYNLDDLFGEHEKSNGHINIPGQNIKIDSDIDRIQKILDKK